MIMPLAGFNVRLLIAFYFLLLSAPSFAQVGNLFSGRTVAASVIAKNIITDYGATCNGIVSDKAAFDAFNSDMQGQPLQVILTIPSGKICCASTGTPDQYYPFKGIPNLIVSGYGATIQNTCNGAAALTWQFGGLGLNFDSSHSARVQSISAGASTATFVTSGDTSKFTSGRRVLLSGIDLQGFGEPINQQIFEYLTIQSIGSGTITFTTPLTNSYLSTWPHYSDGDPTHIDEGGPATLYVLDASFVTTVEHRGLIIDQPTIQTYAIGQSVTYRDVTFTGALCGVPTQNESWNALNVTGTSCGIEVDKMITAMTVTGGVYTNWDFQSSSTKTATFNGGVHITGFIHGSPQVFVGDTLQVDGEFRPGATGYGASTSVACSNCVISNLGYLGAAYDIASYTLSSGTIVKNNATDPIQWCVPGKKATFSGQLAFEYPMFTITGLTQSGSNTLCATTLIGSSFPNLPKDGSSRLFVQIDPAPILNFQSSIGNATTIDVSQAGAQNKPIWTYSSRTYTCAAKRTGTQIDINNTEESTPLWGALDDTGTYKITINVSVADTSVTTPLTFSPLRDAGNAGMPYIGSDLIFHHLPTTVNLKIAGSRVVNLTSVSGTQSGDSISFPDTGSVLSGGTVAPTVSATVPNASGTCPVVSITVETVR